MIARSRQAKVQATLDHMVNLPRPELVELWQDHYKADPPKGISMELMVRAIAYRIQEKAHGGLKPATLRRLRSLQKKRAGIVKSSVTASGVRLMPGARLLREWNGEMHQVEVLEKGFLWKDLTYSSLSSIARDITGARWSEPGSSVSILRDSHEEIALRHIYPQIH